MKDKEIKKKEKELPFGKENYLLFGAAFLVLIIGYLLMIGGKSPDPKTFNHDEIFSPLRITVAPIVILIGFALGFYAILKKPKH